MALAAPLCFTGAWYGAAVPRTVPRSAEAAAPTSGSSVALVKVTKEKLGVCLKGDMTVTGWHTQVHMHAHTHTHINNGMRVSKQMKIRMLLFATVVRFDSGIIIL